MNTRFSYHRTLLSNWRSSAGGQGKSARRCLDRGIPRSCRFLNRVTTVSSRAWESIHQFHPLVRFVSEKLSSFDEEFYPIVSLRLAPEHRSGVPAGVYFFAIQRWTFRGVKEEEWLQMAACDIATGTLLDDGASEALVNLGRVRGSDWLEACNVIDRQAMAGRLDELAVHLESAYARAKQRKQDENHDRLMFQLHGIDQHLADRLRVLEDIRVRHEAVGRTSLVKATQGRIDKLRARIGLKRAEVQRRERVVPDQTLVCAGALRVEA